MKSKKNNCNTFKVVEIKQIIELIELDIHNIEVEKMNEPK